METPLKKRKTLAILVAILMLPILALWLYTTQQTFKNIINLGDQKSATSKEGTPLRDQWKEFRAGINAQIKEIKNLWPSSDTVYLKSQETSPAKAPLIPEEKLENLKNELLKKALEKGQ